MELCRQFNPEDVQIDKFVTFPIFQKNQSVYTLGNHLQEPSKFLYLLLHYFEIFNSCATNFSKNGKIGGIMEQATAPTLSLESLTEGIPVIFGGNHHWLVQKCVFSLDKQGHASGVQLNVLQESCPDCAFHVTWELEVNEQLRKAHADSVESVEDSARALSLLLIRELTPYTAVEQAQRGTTVDYYLSEKDRNDDLIFNNTARLEISGINSGDMQQVNARVKEKLDRLKKDYTPAYIVVVEHKAPLAKMVVKS